MHRRALQNIEIEWMNKVKIETQQYRNNEAKRGNYYLLLLNIRNDCQLANRKYNFNWRADKTTMFSSNSSTHSHSIYFCYCCCWLLVLLLCLLTMVYGNVAIRLVQRHQYESTSISIWCTKEGNSGETWKFSQNYLFVWFLMH